jgi:hypothetical protein
MGDYILNNQQQEISILFNPSNFNKQDFTNYNVWTVHEVIIFPFLFTLEEDFAHIFLHIIVIS